VVVHFETSGNEPKLEEILPQECCAVHVRALFAFEVVYDHIQKHSISITEVQKIKKNKEKIKRLCEAATACKGKKKFSYRAVDSALSEITEEFSTFKKCQSHLSHLCSHISDTVQGKLVSPLKYSSGNHTSLLLAQPVGQTCFSE